MNQASLLMITLLLLMVPGLSLAAENGKRKPGRELAPQPRASLAVEPAAAISSSRAAALVRQHYKGARVLGVTRLDEGGAPLYKIRTLSKEGVVRSVFVDSKTGEVFQ